MKLERTDIADGERWSPHLYRGNFYKVVAPGGTNREGDITRVDRLEAVAILVKQHQYRLKMSKEGAPAVLVGTDQIRMTP